MPRSWKADEDINVSMEDYTPGTSLIVCSDGLWEMVRDEQIKDFILKSNNTQEYCDRLVAAANENGGVDDIAVIIVKTDEG